MSTTAKPHKVGSLELNCTISDLGVKTTVRVPIVNLSSMKPNAGDKLVKAAENVWEVESASMEVRDDADYLAFVVSPDTSMPSIEKALNRVFNQIAREEKLGRRATRRQKREKRQGRQPVAPLRKAHA